ncbi:hypothetical protein FRAHR75_210020 [Frankia sp. Hr75.2]|nr:hypothetical protein FRAHR75_210020 [Frankia sp. Hr75.2]SQE00719.1 hypothetical protein FMEAI12_7090004 [Parafrankia sp. Ea1.12]
MFFLSPAGPAGKPAQAQSLLDFPTYPATGWDGDPPVDARSWAGGTPRLTASWSLLRPRGRKWS